MNPLRNETLRDDFATIIQEGSKTTKSADEIAGEIMDAVERAAARYIMGAEAARAKEDGK